MLGLDSGVSWREINTDKFELQRFCKLIQYELFSDVIVLDGRVGICYHCTSRHDTEETDPVQAVSANTYFDYSWIRLRRGNGQCNQCELVITAFSCGHSY